MRGNVYGRRLPIRRQLRHPQDSCCVTCGHPHWDTLRQIYVRCAMCRCDNVGRNDVELDRDWGWIPFMIGSFLIHPIRFIRESWQRRNFDPYEWRKHLEED